MSDKKNIYDFYLAGPMTGYKDLNKHAFSWASSSMRLAGFTVWNPAEHKTYGKSSFAECMKQDLNAVINQCEKIVVLDGWKNSVGANAEVFVSFVCGKTALEIVPNPRNEFGFDLVEIDLHMYTMPYKYD